MRGPVGLDLLIAPCVIAALLRPVHIGERGWVRPPIAEPLAGEAVELPEILPQAIGGCGAAFLLGLIYLA